MSSFIRRDSAATVERGREREEERGRKGGGDSDSQGSCHYIHAASLVPRLHPSTA